MTQTDDMTPRELRQPLLEAMLGHVPFDGWTKASLDGAAADLGTTPEMAELAFPGGVAEVLTEFFEVSDIAFAAKLSAIDFSSMKIRDRITECLKVKLAMNAQHRELVRRTVPTSLMPVYAPIAARALWNTCDLMWRAIGDTSTDHNWYTKRATLSAVYSSLLLYWLSDESEDYADTRAFLDRRIEDVMTIEKVKAQARSVTAKLPSLSRFLSKVRYPGLSQ